MDDTTDRIDHLQRQQRLAGGRLGRVDRGVRDARDAMEFGDARDERIAALSSERNALLERLARVEGELNELERGQAAARKMSPDISRLDGLSADRAVAPQSTAPEPQIAQGAAPRELQIAPQRTDDVAVGPPGGAVEPNAIVLGPQPLNFTGVDVAAPGNANASSPSIGESERRDLEPGATQSNAGFGPFEPAPNPGGFDPADVIRDSVEPFGRPPEGGVGPWLSQDKSPASAFKPFSEVLHNKQVAELDQLQNDVADYLRVAPPDDMDLDHRGQFAFSRTQFEAAVENINRTFHEHDQERDRFGAKPRALARVVSYEHVVDREMELKRFDMTHDVCLQQAAHEIGLEHQTLLELNENRLSDRPGAAAEQEKYRQMLAGLYGADVQSRTDTLQQQHFPEVCSNGPKVAGPKLDHELNGHEL